MGPLVVLATLAVGLPTAGLTATGADQSHPQVSSNSLHRTGKKGKRRRPNIVVIMTDDQRADEVGFMPQLQSKVAAHGVSFANSVVTDSLCCPSRATYFTGQYAHNHGVLLNDPPAGGYPAVAPRLGNMLPVWLHRAGYHTGLIGRFFNQYRTRRVPPGWDDWHGAFDAGAYGYSINNNGHITHYGSTPGAVTPRTYQTDVERHMAVRFIRQNAQRRRPFYLNVATFAPHLEDPSNCACTFDNPRAAPREEGRFSNQPLPKPPSYNEADVSDKPVPTSRLPSITTDSEQQISTIYRNRLESLLAVDDLVGAVVRTLRRQHALGRTVILFTSDNGWLQGEHRWTDSKILPYEPSIRVPLIIRGPGVPLGVTRSQLVANVDTAPTIMDFARARPGLPPDGRSLRPLLRPEPPTWDQAILLEGWYYAPGGFPAASVLFKGVRTDRYMYARYGDGQEELYDLQADPYELENRAADTQFASTKTDLSGLLERLQNCSGSSCRGP